MSRNNSGTPAKDKSNALRADFFILLLITLFFLTSGTSQASGAISGKSYPIPGLFPALMLDVEHKDRILTSHYCSYSEERLDPAMLDIYSKCVDKKSEKTFHNYINPDEQWVITSTDGFEEVMWEDLQEKEGDFLYVIPVPSEPSTEFADREFLDQVFNRVFCSLFGNFRFINIAPGMCGISSYSPGDMEIPRKQRKLSFNPSTSRDEAGRFRLKVFPPGRYKEFMKYIRERRNIPIEKLNSYMKQNYSFLVISPASPAISGKIPPVIIKFKTEKPVIPEIITNLKQEKVKNANIFIFSNREKGIEDFHRIWFGDSQEITCNVPGFPKKLTVINGEIPTGKQGGEIFPVNKNSDSTVIPLYKYDETLLDNKFPFFGICFALLLLILIEKSKLDEERKYMYKILFLLIFIGAFISHIPMKESLEKRNMKEAGECFGNCSNLLSALEIYHTDKDRYPDTLDQLFPEYMKKPVCPDFQNNGNTYLYFVDKIDYHYFTIFCKSRHTRYIKENRDLVVFPVCGEKKIVWDYGK